MVDDPGGEWKRHIWWEIRSISQHREPHEDQLQLKLHSFTNPPAGVGAKGCNQGVLFQAR